MYEFRAVLLSAEMISQFDSIDYPASPAAPAGAAPPLPTQFAALPAGAALERTVSATSGGWSYFRIQVAQATTVAVRSIDPAVFLLPTPNPVDPFRAGSLPLAPFYMAPLALFSRRTVLPTGKGTLGGSGFTYDHCAPKSARGDCAAGVNASLTLQPAPYPAPADTIFLAVYVPKCVPTFALAANGLNATPPSGGGPIACPATLSFRISAALAAQGHVPPPPPPPPYCCPYPCPYCTLTPGTGGRHVLDMLPQGATPAALTGASRPLAFSKAWLLDTAGLSSFVVRVVVFSGSVTLLVNASRPPDPAHPPRAEWRSEPGAGNPPIMVSRYRREDDGWEGGAPPPFFLGAFAAADAR